MKIRTGFVSNSSSSSFVLKGYLLEDLDIQKAINFIRENYPNVYESATKYCDSFDEQFLREANYMTSMPVCFEYGDEENGIPQGEWFVGKILQDTGEGGYLDSEVIDFHPSNDLEHLKEYFDIKSDIKVVVGTRSC